MLPNRTFDSFRLWKLNSALTLSLVNIATDTLPNGG